MSTTSSPIQTHPRSTLIAAFAAWKSLLLAVALGTALASDYDTSTSIFYDAVYGGPATAAAAPSVPLLADRLTKWDALYFVHTARDAYVYEQEWAFGTGLPLAIRALRHAGRLLGLPVDGVVEPLLGVAIAHVSHLVAVLALYQLTLVLFHSRKMAFVASALHIISPAGLFLSAPYAESPCAATSFLGNLLFAVSLQEVNQGRSVRHIAQVAAGALFGLSTLLRSNGVLSGLLFAVETVRCLVVFVQQPGIGKLLRLVAPVVGGLLVLAGLVGPQVVAWQRYCSGDAESFGARPWCDRTLPSIYGFVQSHYWNVGFLKYWTPGNIPLFMLAAPVLIMLARSSLDAFRVPIHKGDLALPLPTSEPLRTFVQTLAASQMLLAVMAVTSYHVQIITRIASAYPIWYWWIASRLGRKESQDQAWGITVFMVMYAGIQGGLFASFLPPA